MAAPNRTYLRHVLILLPLALSACTAPQATTEKEKKAAAPTFTRAINHTTPAGKLFDAGKYTEALKTSQQELAEVRAANFTKQQKVNAICLVATTEATLARYKDAEAHFKEARALLNEKDEKADEDQLALAMVLHETAKLRYYIADWYNATKYAEKAYNIRKKLLPAAHPDLAEAMATYGFLLTASPDEQREETVAQSHTLMLEAWKIRTKDAAEGTRDAADSYSDLGVFFLTNDVLDDDVFPDSGDDEERVLRCFNKALDIRIRLLGDEHPNVADTLMNLAFLNLHRENHEDAARDTLKAISIFEKTLGKDHPNVAYSYNILGEIRQRQGRLLEAIAHYEKAQKIYETTFGPNHYYIGTVLENLADLYSDMGKTEEVRLIQIRLKRIHGVQI